MAARKRKYAKQKKSHSQRYSLAGLVISTPFGLLLGMLLGSIVVGLLIAGALGLSVGYAMDDHR